VAGVALILDAAASTLDEEAPTLAMAEVVVTMAMVVVTMAMPVVAMAMAVSLSFSEEDTTKVQVVAMGMELSGDTKVLDMVVLEGTAILSTGNPVVRLDQIIMGIGAILEEVISIVTPIVMEGTSKDGMQVEVVPM
jgi:hypothetical protein